MQPETSLPSLANEQAPTQPANTSERSVGQVPDAGVEHSTERHEQVAESAAAAANVAASAIPLPTVPQPASIADPLASTGSPAVAADEDLIEKEWVDKAKHIVDSTKNDPHQQEAAVSQLHGDYLKKRFGKELGTAA